MTTMRGTDRKILTKGRNPTLEPFKSEQHSPSYDESSATVNLTNDTQCQMQWPKWMLQLKRWKWKWMLWWWEMLVRLSTDCPGGKDCPKSNCWVVPLDFQGQEESTTINRSNNDHCSDALFDSFHLWDDFHAAFAEAASNALKEPWGGKFHEFWHLSGLNWPETHWVVVFQSFLLMDHFLLHICHCEHLQCDDKIGCFNWNGRSVDGHFNGGKGAGN